MFNIGRFYCIYIYIYFFFESLMSLKIIICLNALTLNLVSNLVNLYDCCNQSLALVLINTNLLIVRKKLF